jgi:hypothetical protein
VSAGRAAALDRRNSGYAARFVNECEGEPTAANLTRVLARCVRPPRAEDYPAIRRHVGKFRELRSREQAADLTMCRNCGDDLNDVEWYFDPCPASPDGSGDHQAAGQ